MGRFTVYNNITSPEKIDKINPENKSLLDDFMNYLSSIGRAATTIKNYKSDLLIFFCWCEDELNNKSFVSLTKREIIRFQNHAINQWGWSSNRLRTVKAAISSLSNFIENVLDDEIQGYKAIVRKIENPPKEMAREKTVYSEEEIELLLNTLVERKQYERACFVALAAYSGRRKSELLRFRVDDFDEDKLVCDGSFYRSAPIKAKGKKGAVKYIQCYVLAKKFKPYFDLWMQCRKELGIESEWLFPGRQDFSEQLKSTTVDGWSKEFSEITGKPFYPHSLRHAFTTSLSQSGIPDGVIQLILAWDSADMCRLYNDTPEDTMISKYFQGGDVVRQKPTELNEL